MSLFVYPLLGYRLTGSTVIAAVIEAVYLLGLCGMLLPAGLLADRFDRRRLMLAASGGGALLYGSLAAAGLTGHLTVTHLVVVALLTGIASGVFEPAQIAAIRRVVATEDLPTAMSQNQARQHIASLLGGPLGGLLYAVRAWVPFAADAVSYLVSCLTLSRIRTDLRPAPQTGPTTLGAGLAQGFRFAWGHPFIRALMLWSSQSNLLVNATFFAVTLRLVRDGYPAGQIGLVSTFAGTGGILGALAAPYLIERFRTGVLTVVIAWSCVLPLLPLIWWATPTGACVSVFCLVLLNPAGSAGIGAYRVAQTPDDLQGRVGSAMGLSSMALMPLAPLLGGWLLGEIGGERTIALLIAWVAAASLIPTCSRSIRSVPRPSQWRAADTSTGWPDDSRWSATRLRIGRSGGPTCVRRAADSG